MATDDERVLVCYKESQEVVKIDPREDMWTGTFRDPRPINPEGAAPENRWDLCVFVFRMVLWLHLCMLS